MRTTALAALALVSLSTAACDDVSAAEAEALAQRKAESEAFVARAAAEPGAQTLASGVVIRSVRGGSGASPTREDTIEVSYTGRLADGTVFDSTANRGPARFKIPQLIKCWGEGLSQMREGEVAVVTCPADLAYGDRGAGSSIPGGSALEFEITIHEIVRVSQEP